MIQISAINVSNGTILAHKNAPGIAKFNIALSENSFTESGHFGLVWKLHYSTI